MASIANRRIDRHEARSRPVSGIHVGCVITLASPLTLTASSGEGTTERSCLPFAALRHREFISVTVLSSKTLARHARARRGLARDGDRRSVRPERPEENRGQEVAIG